MYIYFVLFFLPVLAFFHFNKFLKIGDNFFYNSYIFIIILFVGLRYGLTDFFLYLEYFESTNDKFLSDLKLDNKITSYGYYILNWLVGRLNFEFYVINLLCVILAVLSFHSFKNIPNKWILWVVVFHTGIIILSMGFVRQGFAIFFVILAINFLIYKRVFFFFLYITLAFLFHKTSIIFFLLILFYFKKINYKYFFLIIAPIILIFIYEIKTFNKLFYLYVEESSLRGAGGESLGVYYRLPISMLVASLFLVYKEQLSKNWIEKKIYIFFSFYIFFLIPVSFASTTLADRMLLYSFPLNIITFCRLESIFKNEVDKYKINLIIILIHFIFFFYWILFSHTAMAWLYYRSYLFL